MERNREKNNFSLPDLHDPKLAEYGTDQVLER